MPISMLKFIQITNSRIEIHIAGMKAVLYFIPCKWIRFRIQKTWFNKARRVLKMPIVGLMILMFVNCRFLTPEQFGR
jgi:hypothetical protein